MTPEQLRELSTVSANMVHVLKTLQEVREGMGSLATRDELREFVTRTEHDYKTMALEGRVERLEREVKDNAPMSVWQRGTQILAGIAVFFAVGGTLIALAEFFLVK